MTEPEVCVLPGNGGFNWYVIGENNTVLAQGYSRYRKVASNQAHSACADFTFDLG